MFKKFHNNLGLSNRTFNFSGSFGGTNIISSIFLGQIDFGTVANPSLSAISFGTPAEDRDIIMVLGSRGDSTGLTSADFGGESAIRHVSSTSSSLNFRTEIWGAFVPTGSTGTVSLGVGSQNWRHAAFYAVYGAGSIISTLPITGQANPSGSITTYNNGIILGGVSSNPAGGSNVSFTNLSKDLEINTTADDDTVAWGSQSTTSNGSSVITASITGANSIYTSAAYVSLKPS